MENEIDLTQFTEGKTVLFDFQNQTIEAKILLDRGLGNSIRLPNQYDLCQINLPNIERYNIRLKPAEPEPVKPEPTEQPQIDISQFTEGKTVLFDFLKRTIETKIEYDKHLGNNFVRFSDTATGAIELTEDNIRWFNIRLKPTQPEPTPQPQTSAVNHPPHYNQYPKEAIDIIIDTFGVSDAIIFCKVNAFKYRLRMGFKGDLLEDFAKEQWYLNKARELREQVAPFTAHIKGDEYVTSGTKLYWGNENETKRNE